MTLSARRYIDDLALANPLYAGATVTVFQVDPATLVITGTLAPLYSDLTSTTQLSNPQQLDSEGKWQQPVYIDRPCVVQVGSDLATTGVQGPSGLFRGTWATAIGYVIGDTITDGAAGANTKSVYYCATPHTSGVFATDLAAGKWLLYVDVTALGLSVASTLAAANAAVVTANAATATATAAATTSNTNANAAAASAITASAAAAAAAASAVSAAAFVFARNALTNGAMDFWQRGASIVPASGVRTYVADRWAAFADGLGVTLAISKASVTAQALQDLGFSHYLSYAVSVAGTANTLRQIYQRIEGVRTLAGNSVTVSFWAWADAARTVNVSFTQNFGTGGSPSSPVNVASQGFTLSTTPTLFTGTFVIPTIHSKTLGSNGDDNLALVFELPTNTTETINVTGVQVQIGSAASTFDWRHPALEMELCQRYYQIGQVSSAGYGASSTLVTETTSFIVTPRALPTITLGTAANTNITSPVSAVSATAVAYSGTVASTGAYILNVGYSADAEL